MSFAIFQLEPLYLLVPVLNMIFKFPEMTVYLCVLAAICLSSCRFVIVVMWEMADYLNIRCFRMKVVGSRENLLEDKPRSD